jgi:GNAT superfamily N-acetyltransferase
VRLALGAIVDSRVPQVSGDVSQTRGGDINICRLPSVRVARSSDVDSVERLLRDCIAAMREAGIEQWDDVYPNRATICSDVNEGTMYLRFVHGPILVGAVVLNEYQNPEYSSVPWTIDGVRVAVVHRLMVDPRYQGNGVARELMGSVEERARELGYEAIRLDAFAANPRALRLYHGLGYHDAGCVTFRKGPFRCFEKRLVPA